MKNNPKVVLNFQIFHNVLNSKIHPLTPATDPSGGGCKKHRQATHVNYLGTIFKYSLCYRVLHSVTVTDTVYVTPVACGPLTVVWVLVTSISWGQWSKLISKTTDLCPMLCWSVHCLCPLALGQAVWKELICLSSFWLWVYRQSPVSSSPLSCPCEDIFPLLPTLPLLLTLESSNLSSITAPFPFYLRTPAGKCTHCRNTSSNCCFSVKLFYYFFCIAHCTTHSFTTLLH